MSEAGVRSSLQAKKSVHRTSAFVCSKKSEIYDIFIVILTFVV